MTIDTDQIKGLVNALNIESGEYVCLQFIASKFVTGPDPSVKFSLSIGDYGSGLLGSIDECVVHWHKSKTDCDRLEKEVADLESKLTKAREEIARRKAAATEPLL